MNTAFKVFRREADGLHNGSTSRNNATVFVPGELYVHRNAPHSHFYGCIDLKGIDTHKHISFTVAGHYEIYEVLTDEFELDLNWDDTPITDEVRFTEFIIGDKIGEFDVENDIAYDDVNEIK